MKTPYLILALIVVISTPLFAQFAPTYDDIWIPMRDNENLSADVYLPSGPGPFEVILIQTPYNKNNFEIGLPLGVGQNIDGQPYAWVVVDWRGFYGSSLADLSNFDRGEDAYDICEWIVDQAWHGNRIGTWGPSALGKVQYNLMDENHPNHTCAVPLVAHPQFSYDDYFYGGVLEEARLETLDALGYGLSPFIMSNVYYSNIWQFAENTSWLPANIKIPTLQIGGWYDHNIDKMMDWYKATRNGALASVQNQQWLLIGPWVHGGTGAANPGTAAQGELSYPNAAGVSNQMAWDFFGYYLLDAGNNWQNTPMITYYETGKDVWNSSNSDDLAIANSDVLFLNENNELNSTSGVGNTTFISDPANPSPTIGGQNLHLSLDQGPYDQNSLDGRSDIAVFESILLPEDVSISGRVKITLYIEADQQDCDLVVRMSDVYPDNRSMLINDGIRRMRFRNGYMLADESLLTPGEVYPIEISLPFVNYTWKAGHKIKIYVGGNSALRWNVNLQDGGTMYQAGTGNLAQIKIHHDSSYPSHIDLPGLNPILGVSDTKNDFVSIFPNPTNSTIYVEGMAEIESLVVTDLAGHTCSVSYQYNAIDVSTLSPGIYAITVSDNQRTIRKKFVKM